MVGLLFSVDLHLSVLKYVPHAGLLVSSREKSAAVIGCLCLLWIWLDVIGLSQEPACWIQGRAHEAIRLRARDRQTDDKTAFLHQCLAKAAPGVDLLPERIFMIGDIPSSEQ
mmetsp:Transcript_73844/g.163206  ORF Transcript_73844/g.163206 Transcript_73844/m.163206 type:complete len:112 (+) Transcript_73844:3-338(+)